MSLWSEVAFKSTLVGYILCIVICKSVQKSERRYYSNYSFPEEFILGVATAAYQIEGGWNEGGKGVHMWDDYTHRNPEFTIDKSNGDVAADSYHRYETDIQMIKDLGVSYYRMSLSWPRILPSGTDNYINKEGVAYYRNIFSELLKANITPFVTLYHWDLPVMFSDIGGWTNSKMIDYFEDYARVVFDVFGDQVKHWITINEPHIHCYLSYEEKIFVPAIGASGIGEYLCGYNMLLAHARVYHLYDKHFRPTQKGKIGITLDSLYFVEPKNSSNPDDIDATERYLQMRLGFFAHPIFSKNGDYPKLVRDRIDRISHQQGFTRSRLPQLTLFEKKYIKGTADFFGINHYQTKLATSSSFEPGWAIPSFIHDIGVRIETNPDWPVLGSYKFIVHPTGFRNAFNWIKKHYGRVPIIVTENGFRDNGQLEDYDRVSYYNEYLNQLLIAKYEDGCNVQGYFAWSLMDDFEWKDGYKAKFGLYHVDFSSANRTRTPRLSAYNFKNIVETRRIDFDYINRTFFRDSGFSNYS